MYILALTDKLNDYRFTLQVNDHEFLTDSAKQYFKDLSWDGMLHKVPKSYLQKSVSAKYVIWGREGVGQKIGDVLNYISNVCPDSLIEVQTSQGLRVYSGNYLDMPSYLQKETYSYSLKQKGKYLFKIRSK